MIRKFITATLAVALAGLFYFTDRMEQIQSHVTVTQDLPRIAQPADSTSLTPRDPASLHN